MVYNSSLFYFIINTINKPTHRYVIKSIIMKILTGEEFHKLPEGVLFMKIEDINHGVNFDGTKYTNGNVSFGEVWLKGESIPLDYYEYYIGIRSDGTKDQDDLVYEAFNDKSKSVDVIFIGSRNAFLEGSYKDNYFAVLERKDIDMIIKELQESKGLDEV